MSSSTDMPQKAKFLFDNAFETPGQERRHPAKPSFDEAELVKARKDAYAEGLAAGLAAARKEQAATIQAALQTLEGAITELLRQQTKTLAGFREDAAALGIAMGRKLSANFARRAPAEEVEALVRKCIEDQLEEPRIVIRASELVTDALKERLDALTAGSGFVGQLVLLPDDRLSHSDCRVEWADGGAERNIDQMARAIEDSITRHLLTQTQ